MKEGLSVQGDTSQLADAIRAACASRIWNIAEKKKDETMLRITSEWLNIFYANYECVGL